MIDPVSTDQSFSPAPLVRAATEADVPAAARTLGRAFADYPWTRHVIDARDHERRVLTMQELFLTHLGLPHGRVWVTDDCSAVAVWTTPETDAGPVFAELGPRLTELAGDRAAVQEAAEAALAPHRPTEPVWFLGTVGVDPDHQGRGLGRAVLAPGIAAADAAGVPAFLETTGEGNRRFYERLGFRVTATVEIPDDGPTTLAMLREPAA
ncbi:GNAT family N-acetyltransferase [Nocardia farcinica]|uniref:GNAT family N-acetyltransferase n=1 Tax=Nocardia farcinica TaxID=37329 RepID=UPI0018951B93|nr:GNAT family N-acetyltransferase [Nocardia farcinica]MBF6360031.1 GNAT family N-acetyltransferase [Nocardia farcinica]